MLGGFNRQRSIIRGFDIFQKFMSFPIGLQKSIHLIIRGMLIRPLFVRRPVRKSRMILDGSRVETKAIDVGEIGEAKVRWVVDRIGGSLKMRPTLGKGEKIHRRRA